MPHHQPTDDVRPSAIPIVVRRSRQPRERWSRTAQWGAVFGASKLLKLESYAPENYHGAATVGNTAWLYKKL